MCPSGFALHAYFLHLSQLYMLSPGKRMNKMWNLTEILSCTLTSHFLWKFDASNTFPTSWDRSNRRWENLWNAQKTPAWTTASHLHNLPFSGIRVEKQSDSCLPLSSSAAKKAARQSSSVTMGPQNQLGIHETTNLFRDRRQTDLIITPQGLFSLYPDSDHTDKKSP